MRSINHCISVAGSADGEAVSLGASFNSDPIRLEHITTVALAILVAGASSLNSTFKVQACLDRGTDPGTGPQDVTGLANWVDVAGTSTTVTADGGTVWNFTGVGWAWCRLVYTRTAGTGTVTMRMTGKGPQ